MATVPSPSSSCPHASSPPPSAGAEPERGGCGAPTTAPPGAGPLRRLATRVLGYDPHWARSEQARLDPATDHERIVHLVGQVRYGDPAFVLALYTVAFARTMSIPSIARTVHRSGRSPIMQTPRKRNDDTMVFFGEFITHGYRSERGRAAIARLNEIHAGFRISNDDNLFTLASLIFESQRVTQTLGRDTTTAQEREAAYRFWTQVGEQMGITGIPPSYDEFYAWTLAYERAQMAPTAAGRAVTLACIDDAALRFAPRWMLPLTRRFVMATFDDHLLDVHGLPRPRKRVRQLVALNNRAYLLARRLLPDPRERTYVEAFGREYGACPHLADVGYHPAPRAA